MAALVVAPPDADHALVALVVWVAVRAAAEVAVLVSVVVADLVVAESAPEGEALGVAAGSFLPVSFMVSWEPGQVQIGQVRLVRHVGVRQSSVRDVRWLMM